MDKARLPIALAPLLLIAAAPADRSAEAAFIVKSEQDWGSAFVNGNVATIDRLLADDFIGIDTHGDRYDKAMMRAWVRAGPNLTSDTVGPVDVVFYGKIAIARGSEHQIGPLPERLPADRIWTDVWAKRGGRWQLISATDIDPGRR